MAASFIALDGGRGHWREQQSACWLEAPIGHPFVNSVVSGGDPPDRRRTAWIAERFHQRGLPCRWFLWPDQQPAVQAALLEELGFEPSLPAFLLSAQTAALLAATPDPGRRVAAALPGARLQPLDRSWRKPLIAAFGACFGLPPNLAALAADSCLERSGPGAPLTQGVVKDGTVLAMAAVQVREGVGGISWVGTDPAWRRRGLGRAVSSAAIASGAALGGRRTVLQGMGAAVELYRAMGFGCDGQALLWLRS
jgi:ribosomal protein S18 acetylase RimI-like enzyme